VREGIGRMAGGVFRSGRSAQETAEPPSRGAGRTTTVAVVGVGPVAAGVATWISRYGLGPEAPADVRTLEQVPAEEPQEALTGVEVVVLVADAGDLTISWSLAAEHRRVEAVAHTQRCLAASAAAGVRHVVVVTSAMVHGAVQDRAPIEDDDDLAPGGQAETDGIVGDLLAVEAVVARAVGRRRPRVTVLRPAAVVGPRVDTLITRHFEAPRLLTVRGTAREWQFVHVDDVASAVAACVAHGLTGAVTVGAPGVLTSAQVALAAGMERIELPPVTAFGTAERLHRVGVLPAPASELAYAVYSWTVTSTRLTSTGWQAAQSNEECLQVLLETVRGRHALAGRRVGARDATALGAAGAAVALIGTAAVWRQARTRRHH